jgi:putative acyl-CoA dehydrogenase
MSTPYAETLLDTHEVTNQPAPFAGFNAYDADRALVEGVRREGAGWAEPRLRALGGAAGDPDVQEHARLANRNVPELRTFDAHGRRIDEVAYHPAWHRLMTMAYGNAVHSLAWTERRKGAHVARAALSYLWNQIENGVGCPTGMSFAAIPALRADAELAAAWEKPLLSTEYDPRPLPVAEKTGATVGMTFTEKQGGSDLRANSTRAVPAEGGYRLTGHKWFCSAPMSDVFFTLAYVGDRATCFLVPRSLPDGTRNRFFIQRLKDKCGNRSNASSEVEFSNTLAWRVGEEGRGIANAIRMAHYTRFDFIFGSAGIMRQSLGFALHHARHRRVFQRTLVDQPLMTGVLADLALECEAALALGLRVARALDESDREEAALLERLMTSVAKYWVCKRAPAFVSEALECLGGIGFVEELPLARLYREAPLNGIWEGSGNVICLDVRRALQRAPRTADVLFGELALARGADRHFDAYAASLESDFASLLADEARGRELTERIALAAQAALLLRHAPSVVAEGFCATRLAGAGGRHFGAAVRGLPARQIIERAGGQGDG